MAEHGEHDETLEDDFSDEQGPSAVEWRELPKDREFFADPFDPPVKSLLADIKAKELIVQPEFQRRKVWDKVRQSRFVESILLNIPIPNLFLAEDESDGRRVVVDGQQRITALADYLDDRFKLTGLEVLAPLNGLFISDLTERQRRIIGNRTLRCWVISSKSDPDIRFQVFERLNQGGMPLNAQEVRNCVYRGELNKLLNELSRSVEWRAVSGASGLYNRMQDCELILRFLAMRGRVGKYRPPLKKFLGDFMRQNRNPAEEWRHEASESTKRALRSVVHVFGDHAFRRVSIEDGGFVYDKSINRAVYDVQMLTMAEIGPEVVRERRKEIRDLFQTLSVNDAFGDTVSRATADKSRLHDRMNMWIRELGKIGIVLPLVVEVAEA